MSNPFTIRIFIPDGDPEGVRIIDRMNWTGLGIVFSREKWQDTRTRVEFERTGVYILVGYRQNETDDLPTLYVGQADGVRSRIDAQDKQKELGILQNWREKRSYSITCHDLFYITICSGSDPLLKRLSEFGSKALRER